MDARTLLGWLGAGVASLALALLVHELGHALGACGGGRRVRLLVLGSGWPTWILRRRPPALLLRPWPLGGACRTDGGRAGAARWPLLLELSGGPLANVALGALLWWLAARSSAPWCGWLAAGQLVLALAQLLPVRPGGARRRLATDGWQLLQLLRGRPPTAPDDRPEIELNAPA